MAALLTATSGRSALRDWTLEHCFIDLAAHPDCAGGLVLLAANPIIRHVSEYPAAAIKHYYLHADAQGSVTTVTDDSFNPASPTTDQNNGYDSFGQPRNANGSADPTWGQGAITTTSYINQERLTNEHLINLNARVYDPALGQLPSPDPIVADISDSQAWNPYAYASNNPMSRSDPTGLVDPPDSDTGTRIKGITDTWDNIVTSSGFGRGSSAGSSPTENGYWTSSSKPGFFNPTTGLESDTITATWTSFPGAPIIGINWGGSGTFSGEPSTMRLPHRSGPTPGGPPSTQPGPMPQPGPPVKEPGLGHPDFVLLFPFLAVAGPLDGALSLFEDGAAEEIETSASQYTLTNTVEQSALNPNTGELVRPFVNSPLTIQEILGSGEGLPDPFGVPGALRYDVPGSFNGSLGNYELVIDSENNIVFHYNFVRGK